MPTDRIPAFYDATLYIQCYIRTIDTYVQPCCSYFRLRFLGLGSSQILFTSIKYFGSVALGVDSWQLLVLLVLNIIYFEDFDCVFS